MLWVFYVVFESTTFSRYFDGVVRVPTNVKHSRHCCCGNSDVYQREIPDPLYTMLLLQESKNILTSTLLVLLLLLCNATCFAHRHVDKKKPIPPKQPPTINVAIVGGGVAGAYAAYALWQANQVVPEYDLNITIFEASGRLGGRATAIEVDGHTVELGASMIYGGNYYLAGDLLKFGLQVGVDLIQRLLRTQQQQLPTSSYIGKGR